MKTQSAGDKTASLLTLLEGLEGLHRELYDVICEKIDRMRTSDIDGMRESIERESKLVEQITEQEALRRQLMTVAGGELGIAAHTACTMNVRQLADRLPEPLRGELLEAADRLRSTVAKVAQRNRVAALVAREILRHFRHVFSAMTSTDSGQASGYTQRGERRSASQRQLLDAVG